MLEWVFFFTGQYILCESESRKLLECSAGRIIMVSDAKYGRTDSLECPHPSVVASIVYDRTASITTETKEKCDLKQSCLPSKSGEVDPFPNVYKYLNVTYECLISGGWGIWEQFGDCSATCGKGVQSFQRKCNTPVPETNETYCIGDHIKNLECDKIPCQGGWGIWEPFGDCSATCGKGIQSFQRKCNSPVPETNETYCIGDHIQNLECDASPCQGSWGCWQTVGHCSHSCGNGTKFKVRECNNPVPTNEGAYCEGENTTLEWCNLRECPVYKWGYLKDLNLTKAELKQIMKEEINELKGNLTVDNKNISSAIRRRISARDDRPSAASFGYFGVVMLAIPIVLMICLDYNHLLPECIKRRIARQLKKVSSSSNPT
ncbi:HMCN [Mytilus coruscus]|uniref:HMCN n=1 Tax=Mytilus coruscus TaxID=42192 RepID=A0A6J8B0X0_MYTCO|nr:HMCN [Mytilus coruscus]